MLPISFSLHKTAFADSFSFSKVASKRACIATYYKLHIDVSTMYRTGEGPLKLDLYMRTGNIIYFYCKSNPPRVAGT